MQTKTMLRSRVPSLVLALAAGLAFVSLAKPAAAQVYGLGAHTGAIGTSQASGQSSKLGYGVHFTANPYGWGAFWIDATFANFDKTSYFSTNPSVILYAYDAEDLKIGVLGGAGFHKFESSDLKFSLNAGVAAEFGITQNFAVGLQARNAFIFDSADVWSVFLTATARFEAGGGW